MYSFPLPFYFPNRTAGITLNCHDGIGGFAKIDDIWQRTDILAECFLSLLR